MNQISPYQTELTVFELDVDEQILWAGKPDPVRLAKGALPFFVLGTGVASIGVYIEMISRTLRSASAATALTLCGLVFLICGLVMLSAPLYCWRSAKSTIYAITNCRALTSAGGKVTARTIEDIGPLIREQHSDGKTDLLFVQKNLASGRVIRDGFFALENYEPAEQLLQKMAEQKHKDLLRRLDSERP